MSELRSLVQLYDHAREHDLPVVLATVVATSGSTYRKPGARMMLCADGRRVGVVSGGCLEGDVTRRAWFLRDDRASELVRYDTGHGEDATYEFGLGCRGVVEVLLERLPLDAEPPIVGAFRGAIERREATSFRLSLDGGSIGERVESIDASDAYLDRVDPPIRLLIFGSGIDARPVARMANELGWEPIVIDGRLRVPIDNARSLAAHAREWTKQLPIDDRTAAVVMTHRMDDDAAHLRDLLESDIPTIGCLGPLSRTEAMLDELAVGGFVASDEQRAAILAPVGLDLGAERPEEIALSIVAQFQARFAQADARPLCEKRGPIHGRPGVLK